MENIIYNELRSRGYNVDVGLVELGGKDEMTTSARLSLLVMTFIAKKMISAC